MLHQSPKPKTKKLTVTANMPPRLFPSIRPLVNLRDANNPSNFSRARFATRNVSYNLPSSRKFTSISHGSSQVHGLKAQLDSKNAYIYALTRRLDEIEIDYGVLKANVGSVEKAVKQLERAAKERDYPREWMADTILMLLVSGAGIAVMYISGDKSKK